MGRSLRLRTTDDGQQFQKTMEKIPCPDCEAEVDYEIGPGESLEDVLDTAVLLQKIEGEEEVEKMDALLSLAITGGDFDWI